MHDVQIATRAADGINYGGQEIAIALLTRVG